MSNQSSKKELFSLVRDSIEEALYNREFNKLGDYKQHNGHQGAFVTLYIQKKLRGCIGHITSDQPLYKTIYELAKEVAFRDDRFEPLTKDEYQSCRIEISLLTEPELIQSLNDIQIGRDGLILQYKQKSGVFLPHVASEYGWDMNQYLTELAEKAELLPEEFNEAKLFKFTTESLAE